MQYLELHIVLQTVIKILFMFTRVKHHRADLEQADRKCATNCNSVMLSIKVSIVLHRRICHHFKHYREDP